MDVESVITEARDITKEESYDDDWMVKRINMGLQEIASLFCIPGLSTSATVSALTTGNIVAMPSDFLHSLFLATTETYPNGLSLAPSLKDLTANAYLYPDTGDVQRVAVEFKSLCYVPIPADAAETITIYYYKNPDAITLVSDLPAWIPAHLQKPLVLSYLCKEIFTLVEEGIDGQVPNTTKHINLYGQGLMMLQQFYPKASKPKYAVTSTPVWF